MKPNGEAAAWSGTSLRLAIVAQFEQVAREQGKNLETLSDDLVLADSDLDSLCFAIIVARLEDTLGFDPFSIVEDLEFPVTFGDFVGVYETCRSAHAHVSG